MPYNSLLVSEHRRVSAVTGPVRGRFYGLHQRVVLQGAALLWHMRQTDACYMPYNSLLVAGHQCVSAVTRPVGRRFYGLQPKIAAMKCSTAGAHEAD